MSAEAETEDNVALEVRVTFMAEDESEVDGQNSEVSEAASVEEAETEACKQDSEGAEAIEVVLFQVEDVAEGVAPLGQ
jgi:hypothetical protein